MTTRTLPDGSTEKTVRTGITKVITIVILPPGDIKKVIGDHEVESVFPVILFREPLTQSGLADP